MHRTTPILALVLLVSTVHAWSQDTTAQTQVATAADSSAQNIQAYINLLRSDVRQDKTEELGAMMQLSASDAAKFWPIYDEYDKELGKVNDLRVANIQDYAASYDHMTDAKADDLIKKALSYRKMRSELLAKTYERVRKVLGGVEAARFIQVEDQLLLIIDLQIYSSLPIVASAL